MRKLARIPVYLVLIFVIFFYGTPFFIILTTSFKTNAQTMSRVFTWIPNPLIIDQYNFVLNHFPYERWLLNSVIVTTGTVALVLLVSMPAGYAFARLKFKGKEWLFNLMLLTIMGPFAAELPQLYLEMYKVKLINTYVGSVSYTHLRAHET